MLISAVKKSDLNEEFRIDSEYYSPDNLKREDAVLKHNHEYLGSLCDLIAGPFGSTVTTERYDENSGKRYIRGKDIQTPFVVDADPVFIEEELFAGLPQFHLKENDILLTVVGMKFGKVAIISNENIPSIFSCKSTLIRNAKINVWYLLTYLSCDVGYGLVRRGQRGAAQPGINLFDIKTVPVPIFSEDFHSKVEYLIKTAKDILRKSTASFVAAQDILLSEIGLACWQPKHQLSFIKNHSDIEQAGRVDAEYFQPKYEEIEQTIKKYLGGYSTIGQEFSQNKSTFKVDVKKIYRYVEIGSVNVSNGEILASEVIGEELPANAKRALRKNDVIVSKVRTYRGAITIVEESGYVGSGAFTVLRENGWVNKETLLAFLHSKPLLAWSLKPNTGTSYPVIIDNDILNLPIPLIPESKQTEIQQKVTESFALRKQSKQLLECGKRAVEIAIEKDEKAAIDWLKDQVEV
jgi:type I restriction enzyme, S subunit